MELLKKTLDLINVNPDLLANVFPIVLLITGCMSGLYMILESVAKFTKNNKDDKIAGVFKKVIDAAKKIVDFFSANVKH